MARTRQSAVWLDDAATTPPTPLERVLVGHDEEGDPIVVKRRPGETIDAHAPVRQAARWLDVDGRVLVPMPGDRLDDHGYLVDAHGRRLAADGSLLDPDAA